MSINAALIPFPHTLNPENEENREELSQSLSSEYYSHAHARAREEDREEARRELLERQRREQLAGIPSYYCETFGAATLPPIAKRDIETALAAGLDPALIYTALDEAAQAPRPSWAYARAILRRLISEDCLTPDAYEQRQARHRARWQPVELPF